MFNISDAAKWFDFVSMFNSTYQNFLSEYNTLINQTAIPPELEDEYNTLLEQANTDYDGLSSLHNLKTDAENFFTDYGQQAIDNPNILGLNGIRRKNLGFNPIIVAAGIGAVAAIGLLYEVNRHTEAMSAFNSKIAYARTNGVSAANQLFGSGTGLTGGLFGDFGGSFSGVISSLAVPAIVIAALIFLGPPVLKMLEGKRT